MMQRKNPVPTLVVALVLALSFGPAALHAQASPSPATIDGGLGAAGAAVQGQGCDPLAGPAPLDLQAPADAGSVQAASGVFYVCLSSDFLCGGCSSGTHCATEACGSFSSPSCTFQTACVSSCMVTSCLFLVTSCGNL